MIGNQNAKIDSFVSSVFLFSSDSSLSLTLSLFSCIFSIKQIRLFCTDGASRSFPRKNMQHSWGKCYGFVCVCVPFSLSFIHHKAHLSMLYICYFMFFFSSSIDVFQSILFFHSFDFNKERKIIIKQCTKMCAKEN